MKFEEQETRGNNSKNGKDAKKKKFETNYVFNVDDDAIVNYHRGRQN